MGNSRKKIHNNVYLRKSEHQIKGRKMLGVFVIVFVIILIFAYLKNDGLYVYGKIDATEIELINKYTIQFPEETIVESFTLGKDINSHILSHNEYIEATLLLPNNLIDDIFPKNTRDYDEKHSIHFNEQTIDDKFEFCVWMPKTVEKWFRKTQRTIVFAIMQPSKENTRVFVYVDKLGWNS